MHLILCYCRSGWVGFGRVALKLCSDIERSRQQRRKNLRYDPRAARFSKAHERPPREGSEGQSGIEYCTYDSKVFA